MAGLYKNERVITITDGREMWETWYQMEQMLISGIDLSPIITHRMHIDDFQEGFDIMESGQCGKVILSWDWF